MEQQKAHIDARQSTNKDQIMINTEHLPNAVLERLIAEVRLEKLESVNAYNRVHNRHNRGR